MGLMEHWMHFPPRIRNALARFRDWDGICEIRLRRDRPLSLTHFRGNLFLDEKGRVCGVEQGLRTDAREIRSYVAAFCSGCVYRYFDTLKDGFLVDEEGYRLGVCIRKKDQSSFLPEVFEGASLRIPRAVPGAAKPFLNAFPSPSLSSTLILSPPGEGKTTLLRDLAISLSRGENGHAPLRTCVVDSGQEIFPSSLSAKAGGLCDLLSGYCKGEGIRMATRLLSPEVILCDEIGGKEEAEAILGAAGGGVMFFATAHAASFRQARARPFLRLLLETEVFSYLALLRRIPGERYRSGIEFEAV